MGEKLKPVSEWQRNAYTFFVEDLSIPLTPEARRRHEEWLQQQPWWRDRNRPSVRLRRLRRFVVGRLKDTWQVFRHGLPENDW